MPVGCVGNFLVIINYIRQTKSESKIYIKELTRKMYQKTQIQVNKRIKTQSKLRTRLPLQLKQIHLQYFYYEYF